MKAFRTLLLLVLLVTGVAARAEKKPTMQSVYIFGLSMSFSDSLAYVTDIMRVDSAYVTSKGFLVNRQLYSLQLEGYMSEKRGVELTTNAVYFSTKPQKLQKQFERIKRVYGNGSSIRLVYIPREDFYFRPEEYYEPQVFEEEEPKSE